MFTNWFKKNRAHDRHALKQCAPGTELAYDPGLIQRFKGHHATLLKLFGTIQESAAEGNYAKVKQTLKSFRRVLEQHLWEENLRLYIYLARCLAHDRDSAELASGMKREMGEIGRNATEFMRHYDEFGVDAGNIEKFKHDLKKIGDVLIDRIRREEDSLYTLYLPPGNYEAAA
jgi:regulator of sigma D